MRSFISGKVDMAFDLIGDLKVPVTISGAGVSTYDHATSQTKTTGATSNEVLGFLEKTYSALTVDGLPIQLRDYLFNKNDIDFEMSVGDSVTVSGDTHPLYSFEDDGFTVTVTVSLK